MTVIDAKARTEALDISRSFIVQAPAGSGKTGVLTQRILKLLAQVDRPEQILAITFTRKAAAEMRARVIHALQQASSGVMPQNEHEKQYFLLAQQVLERDRVKGWQLLKNPDRLRMQTIDSLCSTLVTGNLLTADLGAKFSIEDDSGELYRNAALGLIEMMESQPELCGGPLKNLLVALDNRIDRLLDLVALMLSQREHWLKEVADLLHQGESLREFLNHSLLKLNEEAHSRLINEFPPGLQSELNGLTIFAINNLLLDKRKSPLLDCQEGSFAYYKEQLRLFMTKEKVWRKKVDVTIGFPASEKDYKNRAQALLDRLHNMGTSFHEMVLDFLRTPAPCLSEDEWQLLDELIQVVFFAAVNLKVEFANRKAVDFTEISMAALQVLGSMDNPSDEMLALDERIAHILVDEFQDTSTSQISLLEQLTSGWQPGDGRTLFLVGDPMQSIYAFRKANVGLFLRIWHSKTLGTVSLYSLQLCMNFRSSGIVIDWINTIFPSAFPDSDNSHYGAVRYAESFATRTSTSSDSAQVQLFCGEESEQNNLAEAAWIAEQIYSLEGDGDVAVLVKGKSHFLWIAEALRQKNLPFQAVDIESLSESQIILDLQSLLRVCLSPGDKVAWFALLRGPWCGLTLLELEKVAEADAHPWRALSKVANDNKFFTAEETHKRILHLFTTVNTYYQNRFRKPLTEALRDLVLRLFMPATAQSLADAEAVELFFVLLETLDTRTGDLDIEALQKKLGALFVPPAPIDKHQRKIQIMTMHKSKGLEFDVVFLPQLHRVGRNDDKPLLLLDWQDSASGRLDELLIAPSLLDDDSDTSGLYRYLWHIHSERMQNESVRLLYVACTRARKKLYLSGCLKLKEGNPTKPDGRCLLAKIYPYVEDSANITMLDKQELAVKAPAFRRLSSLPAPALPLATQTKTSGQMAFTVSPEGDAPDINRASGILLHKVLELWGRNPGLIPANIRTEQFAHWKNQLEQSGFDSETSAQGAKKIGDALGKLLANPERVQWLLKTNHQDAKAEFTVSTAGPEGVQHWIIDRTFVEEGVRHIIDYKLAEPTENEDSFLQQEINRYGPQLENYRNILMAQNSLPCRTWLYFPLMDRLVEVTP